MNKLNACAMCSPKDYEYLLIMQYKYWRLELGCQQQYLGWSFIIFNRHVEDLTEINKAEQDELFLILKQQKQTLTKLFNPDKFNYTSLGNITSHLHVQLIPRYKEKRIYNNRTFEDKNWGKNYSPYDKSLVFEKPLLIALRNAIKDSAEVQ